MKIFRTMMIPLLLTVALGACSKDGEELVDELGKLKDEMCACKDKECAEKVKEKERALEKQAREKYKDPSKIDKAILEKLEKLDDELRECHRKHMGDDY